MSLADRSLSRIVKLPLYGVLCGALLAGAGSPGHGAEVDGPQVSWVFSAWGNKRAQTAGIEALAEEVAKATGGRFTIDIKYAEAISPVKENLDGLKIGAFDAAMFCASYHPGKTPALTGLDLPLLPIPDLDTRQAVHEAYFRQPAIVEEMKRWNSHLVMSLMLPSSEIMGKGKPPRAPEDWKGRRVHSVGYVGKVLSSLGATTTSFPAPELYTALERNTIDAVVFPFTYAFVAYRIHELSQWYTTNLALGAPVCPVAASLASWDALPPQYRELIENRKPAAYEALKQAYRAADEKNFPLLERQGAEPITYTDAQRAQFSEAAEPVWRLWVADREKENIPGAALLQSIMDAAKAAGK